ncbi:hypothetical protein XELAEV_18021800mg [Xenopus laevis]|uniref:Uncharacterized protein n=1 Tax=Xenopus laevis TaxID=8355 RepID=A0A974HMK2_XENLA|nr:hypothetical protein XELAEV_18021800mg [Xenopus laevis]
MTQVCKETVDFWLVVALLPANITGHKNAVSREGISSIRFPCLFLKQLCFHYFFSGLGTGLLWFELDCPPTFGSNQP